MISKKLWNSFSNSTRGEILCLLQLEDNPRWDNLLFPYNHDFGYNDLGKKLKQILECLYKEANGKLKVVNYVVPSYAISDTSKIVNKSPNNKDQDELITFIKTVEDYEHSGDLSHEENYIKSICPEAIIVKSWEERDYEAESDYEHEYGELDEYIYQGYVEFKAPRRYLKLLEENGYYSK